MLFLTLDAAAAPVSEVSFVFVGQPACVELSYADGRTLLTNRCPDALLLDQSVQLQVGQHGSFVPAQASLQIRDLSAFTLGRNGQLYRVVATLSEPRDDPSAAEAVSTP